MKMKDATAAMDAWMTPAAPHSRHATLRPERYALQLGDAGPFLTVAGDDQHIDGVALPDQAYLFRTHQGALRVARELSSVGGRRINVVKVR